MKPTYTHTCPNCHFLGVTWNPRRGATDSDLVDWYVCDGRDQAVIGRLSGDPADYIAWPKDLVTEQWATTPTISLTGRVALSPHRILALFMLRRGPRPLGWVNASPLPGSPSEEQAKPRKLDGGEKNFLRLIDKGQKQHGDWARVSPPLRVLVQKLPPELVEYEQQEAGWGRARLTARGAAVLDAMNWL